MIDRLIRWSCYVVAVLAVAFVLAGCDTVQVQYGEASYTRATLFSDKQISEVSIEQTEDGFAASLGKSDTAAKTEFVEAVNGLLEVVN